MRGGGAERGNKLKNHVIVISPEPGSSKFRPHRLPRISPFGSPRVFQSRPFLPVAPKIVSTSGLGLMPLAVERGEHRPFRRVVPEAEAEGEAEAAEMIFTAPESSGVLSIAVCGMY